LNRVVTLRCCVAHTLVGLRCYVVTGCCWLHLRCHAVTDAGCHVAFGYAHVYVLLLFGRWLRFLPPLPHGYGWVALRYTRFFTVGYTPHTRPVAVAVVERCWIAVGYVYVAFTLFAFRFTFIYALRFTRLRFHTRLRCPVTFARLRLPHARSTFTRLFTHTHVCARLRCGTVTFTVTFALHTVGYVTTFGSVARVTRCPGWVGHVWLVTFAVGYVWLRWTDVGWRLSLLYGWLTVDLHGLLHVYTLVVTVVYVAVTHGLRARLPHIRTRFTPRCGFATFTRTRLGLRFGYVVVGWLRSGTVTLCWTGYTRLPLRYTLLRGWLYAYARYTVYVCTTVTVAHGYVGYVHGCYTRLLR